MALCIYRTEQPVMVCNEELTAYTSVHLPAHSQPTYLYNAGNSEQTRELCVWHVSIMQVLVVGTLPSEYHSAKLAHLHLPCVSSPSILTSSRRPRTSTSHHTSHSTPTFRFIARANSRCLQRQPPARHTAQTFSLLFCARLVLHLCRRKITS